MTGVHLNSHPAVVYFDAIERLLITLQPGTIHGGDLCFYLDVIFDVIQLQQLLDWTIIGATFRKSGDHDKGGIV